VIPQISIKTDGLFDVAKLSAWTTRAQEKIRRGVREAFVEGGRELAGDANSVLRSKFNVKSRKFGSAFRVKVYAEKRDRLPAMMIRSGIPWLGIFTHGGVIRGKGRGLLIPLLGHHIGQKTFMRIVYALMRAGSAFFRQVNGKLILFAINTPEVNITLGRFRRWEKVKRGGRNPRDGWIGEIIPIAVLVPEVHIAKRFDLEAIVRRGLPRLVKKIEEKIGR